MLILGSILLFVTAVFVFLGFKLKKSLTVKSPGKAATAMMIVVWILSVFTFLTNVEVYAVQWSQEKLTGVAPANPITKFTFLFALISVLLVFWINRKQGKKAVFWGGVLAAMAGPMIFELPFDLIVMNRTYPPIPPSPFLYRTLFFYPLFLVELTTISLLSLSPLMKVTRYTLFSLAGMFFVFAVWGFLSFSFAYTMEFLILNVVSKALAFITVVTLFLPDRKMGKGIDPND